MSVFARDCLSGKRILITGALGAIGQVLVGKLLEHGATVFANDVLGDNDAGLIAERGRWPVSRYCYLRADVTRVEEVTKLMERVSLRSGGIDIALCHAGIVQSCPIVDYSESDWDRIVSINLKGAFVVGQAACTSMKEHNIHGKVIFTSSWVQDVPWPDLTPYSVTKSGMRTLMRGMARELAPFGITVNAIAPGIVAVGMAKRQWDSDPDYRRRAQRAIPVGYVQPPESVADAMLFLCSSASDYMTGATLLVDGGCSLYPMD